MMKKQLATLGLCVMAALSANHVAQADTSYSNKWRIEISEGANAPGTMMFRVTPNQGSPTDVTVELKGGRDENGVARDIRDALASKLSPGRFDVEVDDGEDVLVKKQEGQPDFSIELLQSSVNGVRVELDRE